MDSHDLARGRGEHERVLRGIRVPAFVLATRSDVLYPLAEQEELAELLPHAELSVLDSDDGHDAFLIAADEVSRRVATFRRQLADGRRPAAEVSRPALRIVAGGGR